MTQPSTLYSWQQTYKIPNNQPSQQQRRPTVRETVHKFDMLGQSNNLSSLPPPLPPSLHPPPIPMRIKNNHTNETPTLSMSSSTGSSNSELIVASNPMEQKRSLSNEKTKPIHLTKPQVSKARRDISLPTQQKSNLYRRRTPPPIPSKYKSNPAHDAIYVNSDNEFEDIRMGNHHNGTFEMHDENGIEEPSAFRAYAKPVTVYKEHPVSSSIQANNYRRRIKRLTPPRIPSNQFRNDDMNSIGLEITEPVIPIRRHVIVDNGYHSDRGHTVQRAPTIIEDYEINDFETQREDTLLPSYRRPSPPPPLPPPPPTFAMPYLQRKQQSQQFVQDELQPYTPKRTFRFSNFMMELGALLVVFILCMVLVLALKEDETRLRTTMLIVYMYIYVVSIIWMIWCTVDIIKFRQQWMELTGPATNQDDYMDISERHSHTMFYFPDIHNSGGLFMKIGAGLLCMGGLILTVIELAETIATTGSEEVARDSSNTHSSLTVPIAKSITYILRFLFHCVQFTFLFRYGNLIIDRYHLLAKIGLIHLIIANFCTWFEAIVFETLEQIHKDPGEDPSCSNAVSSTTVTATNASIIDYNITTGSPLNFIKDMSASVNDVINKNASTLEILRDIEATMSVYLYPCLIEYSLISLTVFFIMWRNVGRTDKRSPLRFGARHVFTVNCARASRGLVVGGIIFLLTILTLVPTYILKDDATTVTHLTELVLLFVALVTVCLSYVHTTKLYYDPHAHVDAFDQVLILITTVGDFAYSIFGLFASVLITDHAIKLPVGIEISIGFLAIFQTFLQTGFILDTLKRRTTTKQDIRSKPGRETITALLLMNLAIWMHDSLSAKKVMLNPLQTCYYDAGTWAIIQAFTSPLSIFYRFHSSVCLADIWQEVYQDNGKDDKHQLMNINGGHDNRH